MSKTNINNQSIHGQAGALIQKYITGSALRTRIREALEEDLGPGDLTGCIFPQNSRGNAYLLAKADGILSGSYLVDAVFRELSRSVKIKWLKKDGQSFKTGDRLAEFSGPMRALLQGERVALNFIQRMSGIATITHRFVTAVGTGKNKPDVFDTRKTTPLLRAFEKKAVLDGGGKSHRFALYDMAMLKNNHIDAAGGIAEAVQKLIDNGFYKKKARLGLCIEARTLEEAIEATWCRADIIMLDNMTPAQIRKAAQAVTREASQLGSTIPELEISGGITQQNIKKYANLPVQRISIGALTHSAPALDISMRFEPQT